LSCEFSFAVDYSCRSAARSLNREKQSWGPSRGGLRFPLYSRSQRDRHHLDRCRGYNPVHATSCNSCSKEAITPSADKQILCKRWMLGSRPGLLAKKTFCMSYAIVASSYTLFVSPSEFPRVSLRLALFENFKSGRMLYIWGE
jgi:hypothetical protein